MTTLPYRFQPEFIGYFGDLALIYAGKTLVDEKGRAVYVLTDKEVWPYRFVPEEDRA